MATNSEQLRQIRVLQELFHGRFSNEDAAFLLDHHGSDLQACASFVLQSEPAEVRNLLMDEQRKWNEVKRKVRRVRQNRSILTQAKEGKINTDARMFACGPCDYSWWRKTPNRKPVSKCKCKGRYDCLPREQEWGIAEFSCDCCNKYFRGWCGMWFPSPCYGCNALVYPTRILPPDERTNSQRPRHTHTCAAPDCPGRRQYRGPRYGVNMPPDVECVHPASRRAMGRRVVVKASHLHDSSGSTVDTFLTQGNLNELPKSEFFYDPLPSIPE